MFINAFHRSKRLCLVIKFQQLLKLLKSMDELHVTCYSFEYFTIKYKCGLPGSRGSEVLGECQHYQRFNGDLAPSKKGYQKIDRFYRRCRYDAL